MKIYPKISVIVPVYNAAPFLDRCINSILSQSWQDFELILIDDGSTDRSGEICDLYASKNSKITVIHTENGGVCVARNLGLKTANGEYITFVDADDELPSSALSDFLEVINKYPNVDLVTSKIKKGSNLLGASWLNIAGNIISGNDQICKYTIYELLGFSAYAKLVRRKLIIDNNIYFVPGITRGEDPLWCTSLMQYLDIVALCDKVTYIYSEDNCESEMHTKDLTKSYCSTLQVVTEVAKILSSDRKVRKPQFALAMEFLAPSRYDQAIECSDLETINKTRKIIAEQLRSLPHTLLLRYMLWRLDLPRRWRDSVFAKYLSALIKRILINV